MKNIEYTETDIKTLEGIRKEIFEATIEARDASQRAADAIQRLNAEQTQIELRHWKAIEAAKII